MPETKQITFKYNELTEMLIKQQNLHEGLWAIFIKFGIQGANLGPTRDELVPAAIVPILEIGIQRVDSPNGLTVDAAKVNPAPGGSKRTGKKVTES